MIGVLATSLLCFAIGLVGYIPFRFMFFEDNLRPKSRWGGASYAEFFKSAILFGISVVGVFWLWRHDEVFRVVHTSTVFAGSAVLFVVAFTVVVPALLITNDLLENNLKPEAYEKWYKLVQNYGTIFQTAVFMALLLVGIYWMLQRTINQIERESSGAPASLAPAEAIHDDPVWQESRLSVRGAGSHEERGLRRRERVFVVIPNLPLVIPNRRAEPDRPPMPIPDAWPN